MKRHQQATTTCSAIRNELQRTAACREGFTILEVLISAGIMVIGLACVASLLPAAAQRMSQAVSEDRAGTLAANAYADITTRRSLGLLSPSRLASDYGVTNWQRGEIFAFGMVKTGGQSPDYLDSVIKNCDNATAHAVDWSVPEKDDDGNDIRPQIFPLSKTSVIEDALTFDDSGGAPVNTFDSDGSRSLRPNPMCWLATVVPDGAGAAQAGDAATVSLAIFKKQPDEQGMRSGNLNGGVLQIKDSTNTLVNVDDDTRRQFVKGCGSVLALGSTPEWIRINASWTDANGTHLICDSSYTGDVVLFTNLLRVEKHRVVLD